MHPLRVKTTCCAIKPPSYRTRLITGDSFHPKILLLKLFVFSKMVEGGIMHDFLNTCGRSTDIENAQYTLMINWKSNTMNRGDVNSEIRRRISEFPFPLRKKNLSNLLQISHLLANLLHRFDYGKTIFDDFLL